MAKFIPYQSYKAFLEPTKETLDGIEDYIRWAERDVPRNIRRGMNELVFHMALVNQREARKLSFGPLDPTGEDSSLAWQLPVRRISGRYYLGWKVRQLKPAVWQLYNDSREAYFIEFGINWRGAGRRVRRPVRKLSLRKTLQVMMTTQAYHRIWTDIYANPRDGRHRGRGFYQIVQSPAGGHGLWKDISEREAMSIIRGNARQGRLSPTLRRSGNRFQQRVWNRGGGTYGGPQMGRRLS